MKSLSGGDRVRLARAALSRLSEPGDLRFTALTTELGPVDLYEQLASQRDVNGVLADVAVRLKSADPGRELERAAARGIRFVIPEDAEWGEQLDVLALALFFN